MVNILLGETDSMIKSYHHDELESFGVGSEKNAQFWNMVFRRALIANYIEKDIEQYGVIKLTEKGHEFLKEPKDFMLMEDHNFEESEEKLQEKGGVSALDNTLFAILKDLRKKIAKKNNLPPYVIFQDPSLEDMCTNYPITLEELANIQGVGTGKAQKYGQEFVEVIKQYVEDNEIERAQDMVVKTVANKSKFKVYIIQNIDRQIDLEDIEDKISDLAGIRIICQFVEDIDKVVEIIRARKDMEIKQERDYIREMKSSGYRSYHIILYYTVDTLNGPKRLQMEVQIRTMAMNFWATVEHSLQYKYKRNIPEHIKERLLSAADAIITLDNEMSTVRSEIMDAQISFRIQANIVADILNNIQNLYRVANKREILKIQDEFYRIYAMNDIDQLERFDRQLDMIAEGYRAQSLPTEE